MGVISFCKITLEFKISTFNVRKVITLRFLLEISSSRSSVKRATMDNVLSSLLDLALLSDQVFSPYSMGLLDGDDVFQ